MLKSITKVFAPQSRVRQFAPAGLMLFCIAYGEIIKLPLVEKLTTMGIGSNETDFGLLALKHDLAIFTGITGLFLLSLMMREYIVAVTIRFISTLLILAWAVDIFIINFFATRLTVGDILKFSGQWNAISTYIEQIFPNQKWLLVITIASVGGLITFFIFTKVNPVKKQTIIALAIFPVGLASVYKTSDSTSYVHAWTYQNIYEVNVKQGIAKQFSDDYTKTLDNAPNRLDKRTNCILGKGEQPNVVVLFFESLSMYHSHTFSGFTSMVPNFDRIAKESTSYTNFFSNGFTTEASLVSVFTGKHMFPPIKGYAAANWDSSFFYRGFHKTKGSLTSLFNDNGYYTAFITTGDLDFLSKRAWLNNIGFHFTEGSEHPFYNNWPRLHFDAAPDEALYKRVLQLLPMLERKAPYMMTIETVSTHQPFVNPYDSNHSEETVFTLADNALGIFYDILRAEGFFENGILVILGDHRSMTGLRKDELDLYGKSSASRVPMVVAYGDGRKPKKIDSFSQQTDFIPSFEYLIGNQSCTGPLNGNFFHEPAIEAEYILFPRGDDRNLIDVFTGKSHEATIRINGEETSLVDGSINDTNDVVMHIGKERLRISRAKGRAHQQ